MIDASLKPICDALKKVFAILKPEVNQISFTILTGKIQQGKSAILSQSGLTAMAADLPFGVYLYYNAQGIVLELGERFFHESNELVAHTLKTFNRCSRYVKISGVILCVDISALMLTEPMEMNAYCALHANFWSYFGQSLGYPVSTALIFTKLDSLAGFGDFFQTEHDSDLTRPLGFSLNPVLDKKQFIAHYKKQFEAMIEMLGADIISKLHPARSSIKRTLIREFPLQVAHLRIPIQALLQAIPRTFFRIEAIYFASALQGGVSVDKVNQRIEREYALTIQDTFPQSTNYRAYFIKGAIEGCLSQTAISTLAKPVYQKRSLALAIFCVSVALTYLGFSHIQTTERLDEVSKELLRYGALAGHKPQDPAAFYHLALADAKIAAIHRGFLMSPVVKHLSHQLHDSTLHQLHQYFLPEMVGQLEGVIVDPVTIPSDRYQALKVYLMLGNAEHFSDDVVIDWFHHYFQTLYPKENDERSLFLLKQALRKPFQPININTQIVTDARNFLNALPAAYLYYALAKGEFPSQKASIALDGFDLATSSLPFYYTKTGFDYVMKKLPLITEELQADNWVLARQDLDGLLSQLKEAYCFEYVAFWRHFIQKTGIKHYTAYGAAHSLLTALNKMDSLLRLLSLIQQETSPVNTKNQALFNKKIASHFTELNLITESEAHKLQENLRDLDKFLMTLSLVQDKGETVFTITKGRFDGTSQTDPLTALYHRAKELPPPIGAFAKQIADDAWFLLINGTRQYINVAWQEKVFKPYVEHIAHRYPLDVLQTQEVLLDDFNHFFAPKGILMQFSKDYIFPFLDTSSPQWEKKEKDGFMLPISIALIDELIRANVISNMFFKNQETSTKIEFSLQKISLDPIVASLQLRIGNTMLKDTQDSESYTDFIWPNNDAELSLASIEGNHFELKETGVWAFFKMLQKVNVLVDNNDSSSLQILFEVNGNSGRYLLKTHNLINPFSPGILSGFFLTRTVA